MELANLEIGEIGIGEFGSWRKWKCEIGIGETGNSETGIGETGRIPLYLMYPYFVQGTPHKNKQKG